MEALNRFELIAPCGMNCGICLGHLREKGCIRIKLWQKMHYQELSNSKGKQLEVLFR